MLDIDFPNRTPSDSILGYSHSAAIGHLTKIVVPPSLTRATCLTLPMLLNTNVLYRATDYLTSTSMKGVNIIRFDWSNNVRYFSDYS